LLLEVAFFEFVLDISQLRGERVETALIRNHFDPERFGDLFSKEREGLAHVLTV
jgi:hypothetical protein